MLIVNLLRITAIHLATLMLSATAHGLCIAFFSHVFCWTAIWMKRMTILTVIHSRFKIFLHFRPLISNNFLSLSDGRGPFGLYRLRWAFLGCSAAAATCPRLIKGLAHINNNMITWIWGGPSLIHHIRCCVMIAKVVLTLLGAWLLLIFRGASSLVIGSSKSRRRRSLDTIWHKHQVEAVLVEISIHFDSWDRLLGIWELYITRVREHITSGALHHYRVVGNCSIIIASDSSLIMINWNRCSSAWTFVSIIIRNRPNSIFLIETRPMRDSVEV